MTQQKLHPKHPCKNCKKTKGHHRSGGFECPLGSKHRTLGYTSFYAKQVYEPKENWKPSKKILEEDKKNEEIMKLFK